MNSRVFLLMNIPLCYLDSTLVYRSIGTMIQVLRSTYELLCPKYLNL